MAGQRNVPFEYHHRHRDHAALPPALLEQRDRDLEDYLARSAVPLVFHWPGVVSNNVNVRNGPHKFAGSGTLYRLDWAWDNQAGADATVDWYFDDEATPFLTSTVDTATATSTERPNIPYDGQRIIGICTAVDAAAAGLTAFWFLH